MRPSRRRFLTMLAAGGALTACSSTRVEPAAQPVRTAPLPAPFQRPLTVPPVLRPEWTDSHTDYYRISVRPARTDILPGLPTTIWGYDGRFPGPTIHARRGRRIELSLRNELAVPVVNHLHGGRVAPEHDGYPTDLVLPADGSWDDHTGHRDPRAKTTQGERVYDYPNDQPAATLWYHDHRMDFTGPQVWRGLAGFYLLADDAEGALPLPGGERDVPLMLCDRTFGEDGSLLYPSRDPSLRGEPGVRDEHNLGVFGDVVLVNGIPWPYFEVSGARYRLRLLNASNARRYELFLDPPPSDGAAFVQIGSDGGLLPAPVPHQVVPLAAGERFDVVVDFSAYPPGTKVLLRNGAGDGQTGLVMRFHVGQRVRDDSAVPSQLVAVPVPDPADSKVTRQFKFGTGKFHGHVGWSIDGEVFDPAGTAARPRLGDTEIWELTSDLRHPVHLHLVHFHVLSRSGGLRPGDAGLKDTVDVAPGHTVSIIARFTGHRGRYVFHCHNLEHEDMGMMGNFEVV